MRNTRLNQRLHMPFNQLRQRNAIAGKKRLLMVRSAAAVCGRASRTMGKGMQGGAACVLGPSFETPSLREGSSG
jgi:hypothetical protein